MHLPSIPKPFLIIIITLMAFSGIALWREISNTLRIQKEIVRLEQQAAELEQKNKELNNLINYLTSPVYQERAAREQLNLQLPGEVAVALPNNLSQSQENTDSTKDTENDKTNPQAWWDYFFAQRY